MILAMQNIANLTNHPTGQYMLQLAMQQAQNTTTISGAAINSSSVPPAKSEDYQQPPINDVIVTNLNNETIQPSSAVKI